MNTATLYPVFIQIHHYLSWGVLLFALLAALRGWTGVIFTKRWNGTDVTLATLLTIFADLQLLTGVILYAALSPVTRSAFTDFGAAMSNPAIRFFAVEHIIVMVIAVVIIHIARGKARDAQFKARKHRISAVWYTIALALILTRVPWDKIFVA